MADGCLWLSAAEQQYLVIWPANYSPENVQGQIAIKDDTGRRLAFVGDRVTLVGGELADVSDLIGVPIPEVCRTGSYWVGGLD